MMTIKARDGYVRVLLTDVASMNGKARRERRKIGSELLVWLTAENFAKVAASDLNWRPA